MAPTLALAAPTYSSSNHSLPLRRYMPVWLRLFLPSPLSIALVPQEVHACMAPPLPPFSSFNCPCAPASAPKEVHACMAPPLALADPTCSSSNHSLPLRSSAPGTGHSHLLFFKSLPAPQEVHACMAPPLPPFSSFNCPCAPEVHACMAPPLSSFYSWNCPCAQNSTDF
ncbi:hypothetical protein XELAEV_18004012mg [Xenopus laevis]|uniref:Uncharacterized protein n=1 Tax=Xenopus laevis TaxID=8355 RepID=A0A974BSD3_XENLA|nr:hypothetical protein XELAEV_18004012mg [Xenopus laevis]